MFRLLPLIAVIAPTTLTISVSPDLGKTFENRRLATVNWTYPYFMNYEGAGSYDGPARDLVRIGMAVSSTGAILNIPPIAPNASSDIQFYGPAIQCSNANASVLQTIKALRQKQVLSTPYVGFVPSFNGSLTEGYNASLRAPEITNSGVMDTSSGDTAKIWFATGI